MEIYAFGLLVIVGLIWAAIRVSKGAGYTEAELDEAQAMIDAVAKSAIEAKENEKNVANLTDDELINRLSK